jgi:hypothetical protein
MATPRYERLAQEGDPQTIPSRTEAARLTTYYPDLPSSDDEDENLLEKNNSQSPGNIERGQLDMEEDEGEGLVVGRQKQRPSSLRLLIYSLVVLVLLAGTLQ